jgi:hypothetical protein
LIQQVEHVTHDGKLIAVVIPSSFRGDGIEFFTPNEFSQQLAYMHYPQGKVIEAHVHNPVMRGVQYTQEVLVIKRGKLRVDFYDDQHIYLESRVLRGGDVILLASGGHGFEVLQEVEMVEVKQGPYTGDQDKTRFASVESSLLRMKKE